jgi:hypothetical protein
MVKVDDPSVRIEQQSLVFGDAVTPVKGPDGKTIVDMRVHDWIDFSVPSQLPTQPLPLPAGMYAITVLVDNVTGVSFDGSVPPKLESNRLLIKIEPDVNVRYKLWSERGRCIQETWGWGGDEIWWDAFVGHAVPKREPSGNLKPELKDVNHVEFPRPPWEDMDSGESSGPYSKDLFGPAAFELGGVVAVGLIGFEVDDEDSAKEQLQNFSAAFWKAIKAIIPAVVVASGSGFLAVVFKAIALSLALYLAAAVAAVIVAAAWLWASWAPADLISLDVFTFDALKAWDATDLQKPLPPETKLEYRKGTAPFTNAPTFVTVFQTPMKKEPGKGQGAPATWVEEHYYETPSDDEASSYVLEFRLART